MHLSNESEIRSLISVRDNNVPRRTWDLLREDWTTATSRINMEANNPNQY